jgi:hypothetical protein
MDMPLTPMRVWQAITAAQDGGDGPRATEQGRDVGGEHGRGASGSGPASPSEGGGA